MRNAHLQPFNVNRAAACHFLRVPETKLFQALLGGGATLSFRLRWREGTS